MKKAINLLLLVIIGVQLFFTPINVNGKEEQELTLPKLYFYGDVDKIESKSEEIKISVKYVSDGVNFDGYAKIKWQGSSSIAYAKKNYTIKFYKDANLEDKLKIDFGWGNQNKYCLKANWVDKTHSRNVVTAKIAAKMQKKYGLLKDTPNYGVIDGFPIEIYLNDSFLGLYTLNIPKDAWMFGMDEDNSKHTVLAGDAYTWQTYFNATVKELDKEFALEAGVNNEETINALNRLITFVKDSTDDEFKNNISEYLNLDSMLNYYSMMQLAEMMDNHAKNMLLVTYDQKVWYTSLYDLDTTWGTYWNGSKTYNYNDPVETSSNLWNKLKSNFPNELANRYYELRKSILSKENIMSEFNNFYNSIPEETWNKENSRWKNIPGYGLEQISSFLDTRLPVTDKYMANLYTTNMEVAGVCEKNNDGTITAKVNPLRNDIIIENNDSYTFDDSGSYTFVYKDFVGNIKYLDVAIDVYKKAVNNPFEK